MKRPRPSPAERARMRAKRNVLIRDMRNRKKRRTLASQAEARRRIKFAASRSLTALFQRCVGLRSKGVTRSNLGGHFKDFVEVAFATIKDAMDAVNRFQNRIKLFQQIWRITLLKPKQSSGAAFSSSLRISDTQKAPESSDGGLAKLKRTIEDGDVGSADSTKVAIYFIDDRVPIEVVTPLFTTVGSVRSRKFLNNSDGIFKGTVEVEYEQAEDAVAAAKLLNDNISFFGRTWYILYAYEEDEDDDDEDEGEDDDDEGDDDDDDEEEEEEEEDGGDDNNGDNEDDGESDGDVGVAA